MKQYLDIMRDILINGVERGDRTGTGTYSVFGRQLRFNLADGFPLVTTKKVYLKGIIHELLWFIKGDTNIKYLQDNNVHIWDEWADENGNLGPVYGKQWRRWQAIGSPVTKGSNAHYTFEIDQLKNVICQIKTSPDSRRLIVSAWNPADVNHMALPPCHCFFQFYVANGRLSCQLYQRSADWFLGVPFNIASYSLLTMMVAQVCGLKPGEFVYTTGDTHLYLNHVAQAVTQLRREPYKLPKMWINSTITDIEDFKYEHFALYDYECHPAIKADVSV